MDYSQKKQVLAALEENILNLRFENLDPDTVENTKKRILDVTGDILGGAGARDNALLVNLYKEWGGRKESTILGYGLKIPTPNAAYVNSVLCNSFDSAPLVVIIDGKRIPSHTSGATIPTAITIGESRHITGKELITTLVAAEDFVARLHCLNPGRIPATTLGAAAVASRVLGLNNLQMRHAFGIALDYTSGKNGGLWDGSPTFKTGYGQAAYNGIMASQLAIIGWTGAEDSFFGERGSFFDSDTEVSENLIADLGKKFYVEQVFKPYPGCRLTHVGIGAALALISKHDFRTDNIEKITLGLPMAAKTDHCSKPFQIRSYPAGDALFSYRYSIATTLLRKRAINQDFTEEAIRNPEILELIDKIELVYSPQTVGAELNLKMKNGSFLAERLGVAKGDITTPLSLDELKEKFMRQIEFSQMVKPQNAEKLLIMLERLDEIKDISQIVALAIRDSEFLDF